MPVPDELVLIPQDTAWPPSCLGAFPHAGPLRAKAAPCPKLPRLHYIPGHAGWSSTRSTPSLPGHHEHLWRGHVPSPQTPAAWRPHGGEIVSKPQGAKVERSLRPGLRGGGDRRARGAGWGQCRRRSCADLVSPTRKPWGALSSPHATCGETEAHRGEKTCARPYWVLVVMPTMVTGCLTPSSDPTSRHQAPQPRMPPHPHPVPLWLPQKLAQGPGYTCAHVHTLLGSPRPSLQLCLPTARPRGVHEGRHGRGRICG